MPQRDQYDVFVSYAHADNEIAVGSAAAFGWVTALAQNLNTGPNVYKKSVFIDHRLKPGDVFSEDLIEKVANSSLLLILLSQNYIDSQWCGKELEHFIRTHAKDRGKPTDVFVAELFPYESFQRVPSDIQNLRKRLIHAKFWHQPPDGSTPLLAGDPTPLESGLEKHYWRVLKELRAAIDTRLRTLTTTASAPSTTPLPTPSPDDASARGKPSLGPILLAAVTEDLEDQRSAFKAALEPEGVVIVPAMTDYVGLSAQELETAIAADLEQSALFIQLLSPTVGRKARGWEAPLPQVQFQRAVAANLPIMQWCEQLPERGRVMDLAHAKLFDTPFLRSTNLPAFQAEVVDWLRAQAKPAALQAAAGKKVIFVDDVAGAPALNEKLLDIIQRANWSIRSVPSSAQLGANGIDIKETLRLCRAGITIYVDRAKHASAYNRLMFFLNQVIEASLPLARWAVYLEQGTVASEFGIVSNEVVPVNERSFADFLTGL